MNTQQTETYDVDHYIKKFSAIPEIEWCTISYSKQLPPITQYCALGHCAVFDKNDEIIFNKGDEATTLKSLFTNRLQLNVAAVNDGDVKEYQQSTPKQRILAALADIKRLQSQPQPHRIIGD